MITVLTVSSTVIATLLTYALPAKYYATAVVLVRPKKAFEHIIGGESKKVLDFPLSQAAPTRRPRGPHCNQCSKKKPAAVAMKRLAVAISRLSQEVRRFAMAM